MRLRCKILSDKLQTMCCAPRPGDGCQLEECTTKPSQFAYYCDAHVERTGLRSSLVANTTTLQCTMPFAAGDTLDVINGNHYLTSPLEVARGSEQHRFCAHPDFYVDADHPQSCMARRITVDPVRANCTVKLFEESVVLSVAAASSSSSSSSSSSTVETNAAVPIASSSTTAQPLVTVEAKSGNPRKRPRDSDDSEVEEDTEGNTPKGVAMVVVALRDLEPGTDLFLDNRGRYSAQPTLEPRVIRACTSKLIAESKRGATQK